MRDGIQSRSSYLQSGISPTDGV